MKKRIIATILGITSIATITAAGLFLPVLTATKGYAVYEYDYASAYKDENTAPVMNDQYLNGINVSLKELIWGTKRVNNGTYVLYLGSNGYSSHRSFLYGNKFSSINQFEQVLTPPLDGVYGDGVKYLNSDEFKNWAKSTPKLLTYIDNLTTNDFRLRKNYDDLVKKYKKLPLEGSVEADGLSEDTLKENKKKFDWANEAPSFSFEPGAVYTDWEGKTQYFRGENNTGIQFNEIIEFVKKNYPNLNEINNSNGVIIGFKNGQMQPYFAGSFSEPSNDDNSSDSDGTESTKLIDWNSDRRTWSTFSIWLKTCYVDEK